MSDWPSNEPPEEWNLEQRSKEWKSKRFGMATASQFHRVEVLTRNSERRLKGDWSEKTYTYLYELIAEKRLQRAIRDVSRYSAVQYGVENEDRAAEAFCECFPSVTLLPGGFFTKGGVGCSPDRLIGEDELLEIKCPTEATQIRYLIEGLGNDHKPQLQGQLMITGRKCAHFLSWRHDMPSFFFEVLRDEVYINELWGKMKRFTNRLAEDETKLLEFWPIQETIDV